MKVDSKRFFHFTKDEKAEAFLDSNPTYTWTNETPNRRTIENQLQYRPIHIFQGKNFKHLEY
jgi:hypothetical protein